MGKLKAEPLPATTLRIGLFDPGMTPLLRAGLGGLAAAARTIGERPLAGRGSVMVTADAVVLDWRSPERLSPFLEALFGACFAIREGLIDLPGSHPGDPPLEVRVAISDALRFTFLQHVSSAKKAGAASTRIFEIDEKPYQVLVQGYRAYVHQDHWKSIAKELGKPADKIGPVYLAGWANPGAVERHVALGCSHIAYTPAQAICACFALIGCLSYQGPNRSGVLIIPEPADLRRFAGMRPHLAPRTLKECFIASPGDGVLAIHAALRAESLRQAADGLAGMTAMALRSTSWARQQKTRTDALVAQRYPVPVLEAFNELMLCCPSRIVATKGKKTGGPGGYWGIPSSLRGFVADNLARIRPFYMGFSKARTRDDPPRFLHRFHSNNDNLGALRNPDDQKGLIAMTATLDEAERRLVAAIHTALKQRFGAIAAENEGRPAAFKNRCQGERDKWRLALSGARTHEQVRHALASLWSRAGTVRELQGDGWQALQPLLRPEVWEAARDLALIALASYQGKGAENTESTSTV